MADPTKNIRKFAGVGIFVGLIVSAMENGAIIIGANPEARIFNLIRRNNFKISRHV